MIKHLFTILVLMTVILPLSSCSGEEAAPKKAVVDVKSTKPSATQTAAKAVAVKATTATAANAGKAAPVAPTAANADKAAAAAKGSTAVPPKSTTDSQKAAPAAKVAGPKADTTKPADESPKATVENNVASDKEQPDEPLSALTVPKGYRYQPRGRRDPFVSPIAKPVAAAAAAPVARPDGLPGVMVSEMKISGIVYARDPAMKKAILAAGRKTYFAKQGDHLFDAVIKEIRPSEVVFTMVSTTTKKPLNRETIVSTGGLSSGRR